MCGIALGVSFSVAGLVLGSVGSAQAADTSQVAVDCPPGVTAAVGDSSVSLAAPSLPTRLTCPIIGPLPVVRASLAGGLVTVNTAAWD
ncbi:MAG TPA: hypothetical protein VIU15_23410 [Streptomyces sp.]